MKRERNRGAVLTLDTLSERTKFLEDAQRLTDDIVAAGGPMSHVRDLVNVWGVFVPSNKVSPN